MSAPAPSDLTVLRLLNPVLRRWKRHGRGMILGILVVSGLLFCLHSLHRVTVSHFRQEVLLDLGLESDQQELDALQQRIKAGDSEAVELRRRVTDRLAQKIATIVDQGTPTYARSRAMQFVLLMGPFNLLFYLAWIFITTGALLWYLLVGLAKTSTRVTWENLLQSYKDFLRICAIVLVRSYACVPFIGILLGRAFPALQGTALALFVIIGTVLVLIEAPRAILALVVFAEGHRETERIFRIAEERAKGHWWPILIILASVGVILGLAVAALAFSSGLTVKPFQPFLSYAISTLGYQIVLSILVVYGLELWSRLPTPRSAA